MLSEKDILEIINKQIVEKEKPGEHAGGSGHLSFKNYRTEKYNASELPDGNIKITYRYTTFVESEFTFYPGNPPYEQGHEEMVVVDKNGVVVSQGRAEQE